MKFLPLALLLLAAPVSATTATCNQAYPDGQGFFCGMARRKWDESKVKRDESGRFIAQANHVERQDAGAYRLNNQFDPLKGPGQRTRLNAQTGKPLGPLIGQPPRRRSGSSSGGSMWIQVGGKSKSRTY